MHHAPRLLSSDNGFAYEVFAPLPAPLTDGVRVAVASANQRRVLSNNAKVRAQANCAAAASKRGVVSLLKPCCVPAYLKAACLTPALFSATSYAGMLR